jgi:hypothetical protein
MADLFSQNSDCLYFEKAMKAAALSIFGNVSHMKPFQIQAQQYYCACLPLISEALGNATEVKSDRLLASILMLNTYEVTALYKDSRRHLTPGRSAAGIEPT